MVSSWEEPTVARRRHRRLRLARNAIALVVTASLVLILAFTIAGSLWFAAACACGPTIGAPHRAGPVTALSRGWPVKTSDYFGRYRMISSSDHAFAGSALLAFFMRHVLKPKKMTVPGGVLSAFGRDETTVLYLTKLRHEGTRGVAEVSAGNYTLAPVGRMQLLGFDTQHHTLWLEFVPAHGPPVEMDFVRFSSSPQP